MNTGPGSRGGEGHFNAEGKFIYTSRAYTMNHRLAQPRLRASLNSLNTFARNPTNPDADRKAARQAHHALDGFWIMSTEAQEEYLRQLEHAAKVNPERLVNGLKPIETLALLHYYDPRVPGEALGQNDGSLHYQHGNNSVVAAA